MDKWEYRVPPLIQMPQKHKDMLPRASHWPGFAREDEDDAVEELPPDDAGPAETKVSARAL